MRKPSHSSNNSPESSGAINTHRIPQPSTDVAPEAAWFKSSYSDGTGNNCVEAADLKSTQVGVRDSKNKQGPALVFRRSAWTSFITGVSHGDLPTDAYV
ncbi:DUF397 domain-containing protein [Streptomyces sp. CRN 30]|uniref:DUF397 domain-containing protein n=1 Tax=Streptomyces sp. CRN 30 TaxID=3075613 RepID=UPI002A83DA02|nr:DUF397 domain-containing protein [Streptomyces sp. CRN 30]